MKAHDRRGGWPLPIGPHPESSCDTPTAQGAMGSEGPLEAPWTCRVSDQDAPVTTRSRAARLRVCGQATQGPTQSAVWLEPPLPEVSVG